MNKDSDIHIFQHVHLSRCGLNIAAQQIHLVSLSGLLGNAKSFNVGIVYDDKNLGDDFLKILEAYNIDNNINVMYCKQNNSCDERDTGIEIKKRTASYKNNDNILYFHTKGSSRCNTKHEKNIIHWRQVLEYHCIVRWQDCIDKLASGYESCGSLWSFANWTKINKKGNHYSGTFYWVKASLFKCVPESHFHQSSEYGRYSMEAVPSLSEHKSFSFFQVERTDALYNTLISPKDYVSVKSNLTETNEIKSKVVNDEKKSVSILDANNTIKTKNKKVVYTCITNDYDILREPLVTSDDWDYICFSDRPKYSEKWKVIMLPDDCMKEDSKFIQRKIKILPHLYLSNYDESIWIDGNIELKTNPNELTSRYLLKPFNVLSHPFRNCVYDEMKAVISHKKENQITIEKFRNKLTKEKYPIKNGLVQTNVIIRRHNIDESSSIGNSWWYNLKQISHRDQLTFNYTMWKFPNLARNVSIFTPNVLKIYFNYYNHGQHDEPTKLGDNYGSIPNYINGVKFFDGDSLKLNRKRNI